jgi:alkylation response protein AidB-like acyl-CoA dehydrogenase
MLPHQRNILHEPGVPGFLESLYLGNYRWDLIEDFPEQDPLDEQKGTIALGRLRELLQRVVDPERVDAERRIPDGLLDELRKNGFLRMQTSRETGGLTLSAYNAFRVIQTAASWSVAVSLILAIENAVGLGGFLSVLPDGGLRDRVLELLAAGVVSGAADTEPSGASNSRRSTVAEMTPDGTAFLLSGEKIYIGNGPIADFIFVTAMVTDGGKDQARLFLVDTRAAGFTVESWHEYMGVKGFPNAALTLDRVRVPREMMFIEHQSEHEVRITGELSKRVIFGRLCLISAPALAIARLCLHWSRNFVNRRFVDGRNLGDYDEIQRIVATSLAEVFAIEAITDWSLLHEDNPRVNVKFEHNAAKNISSVTSWRIVDRTMSLLAGEGYETAASKAQRGAVPFPLERFYRDARNLRISGAVDFQIDNWTARMLIFSYYYPTPAVDLEERPPPECCDLCPENQAHLRFAATETRRFGITCRKLANRYSQSALAEREHLNISLSRIVNEILTMSLVLARAAKRSQGSNPHDQALAHVFCVDARRRIAELWAHVNADVEPDYAAISSAWHGFQGFDHLLTNVITEPPRTS